jgi:hypothetical protein
MRDGAIKRIAGALRHKVWLMTLPSPWPAGTQPDYFVDKDERREKEKRYAAEVAAYNDAAKCVEEAGEP